MDQLFLNSQQWLMSVYSTFLPGGNLNVPLVAVTLAVLLIIACALSLLFAKRRPRYEARPYLFTKTEWRFAQSLCTAIGTDYLLMGKVRIADLLSVERQQKFDRSSWMRQFAKISSKHVDYVLIDPATGKVACCLELDDASHQRADRIQRDVFVNGAFKEAGVPLLRIPTSKHYDVEVLRQRIRSAALV